MNKILTLYDIEFKRVKNVYFSVLGLLGVSNIIWFVYMLNSIKREVEGILNIRGGLSLLKSEEAYTVISDGGYIYSLYSLSLFFMIMGLIWCLYYTLLIWYKDFSSKTKVAYTLFTLPCNKFKIFLSKLILMVSFIYGILATQHILWVLEMLIIKSSTGISISEIIHIINYNNAINFLFVGIYIYPLDLFMCYILGPILVVIVLFTGVLIHKSFNKIGGFIGLVYVLAIIFIYLFVLTNAIVFTDLILKYHIVYYILIGVSSILISYILLNKRIHL